MSLQETALILERIRAMKAKLQHAEDLLRQGLIEGATHILNNMDVGHDYPGEQQ